VKCKRCSGNVYASTDHYGKYLYCAQCGWHEQCDGTTLSQVKPRKRVVAHPGWRHFTG
jgi:hypothetical protein